MEVVLEQEAWAKAVGCETLGLGRKLPWGPVVGAAHARPTVLRLLAETSLKGMPTLFFTNVLHQLWSWTAFFRGLHTALATCQLPVQGIPSFAPLTSHQLPLFWPTDWAAEVQDGHWGHRCRSVVPWEKVLRKTLHPRAKYNLERPQPGISGLGKDPSWGRGGVPFKKRWGSDRTQWPESLCAPYAFPGR